MSVIRLKKFPVDLPSRLSVPSSFLNHLLFSLPPVLRHRTVLVQVVPVIEGPLLLDHMLQDPHQSCFEFSPHPREAKDILKELVSDLLSCQLLVIQSMFLEEPSLAVHVRAIEHTVPIDRVILKSLSLLGSYI